MKFNGKKNKSVVLLSTLHHKWTCYENTGKPEIIENYYSTKGSVDCLDQLVKCHSVKRATRRWSVFFKILWTLPDGIYTYYMLKKSISSVINISGHCDIFLFLQSTQS